MVAIWWFPFKHFSSRAGTIVIPTFQMKKLRHKAKSVIQGLTEAEWAIWFWMELFAYLLFAS